MALTVDPSPEGKATGTLPSRPKDNPWKLKMPSGASEFTMHTDEKDDKPARHLRQT